MSNNINTDHKPYRRAGNARNPNMRQRSSLGTRDILLHLSPDDIKVLLDIFQEAMDQRMYLLQFSEVGYEDENGELSIDYENGDRALNLRKHPKYRLPDNLITRILKAWDHEGTRLRALAKEQENAKD